MVKVKIDNYRSLFTQKGKMNGLSLCLVILSFGYALSVPVIKFSFVIKKDTMQTVELGRRAIIDCTTDDQGAKVSLYKTTDGNNYSLVKDGPNVQHGTTGMFHIKKTFYEDSGSYRCYAVDQLGNVITRNVLISLDTSTPKLAIKASSHYVKVYAGDDFKLKCEAVRIGANLIKWQFVHMSQKLSSQDYSITTKQVTSEVATSVLHVTKAKEGFTGYYQCKDNGYYGQMADVFVDVIVPKAPYFKKSDHETKSVNVGKDLDLACKVYGSPMPTVFWMKDGKTIPTCKIFFNNACYNANYLKTDTGLKIRGAAFPRDNGTFSCVATNEAGTSVKTFDVTVQAPPHLTAEPSSDVVFHRSQPKNITCRASGNPAPTFTWKMRFILYNNEKLPWGGKSMMVGHKFYHSKMSSTVTIPFYITHVEYQCTAVNVAGKDSIIIKFTRA